MMVLSGSDFGLIEIEKSDLCFGELYTCNSMVAKKNAKHNISKSKKSTARVAAGLPFVLRDGDVVDVVAPGSASRAEDVEKALSLLRAWGLRPRLLAEFSGHPFHSCEDGARLKYLEKAILASDSRAIFCLRGGYGSLRLIPDLLKAKAKLKKAKPKIFLGYSDITTLHVYLRRILSWPLTLHGPLLESMVNGKMSAADVEHTRQILFGQLPPAESRAQLRLQALNASARSAKKVSGYLIGGNLNVLQSSLGTKMSFACKERKGVGEILVLEDIGERGYRVDRMLEHLHQAGAFAHCAAVVFADFSGGKEADGSETISFAMQRFADLHKIPCYKGLPMGHGEKNIVVPFGALAEINFNKKEFSKESLQPSFAEMTFSWTLAK